MSESLQALYEGDVDRARQMLPPDADLSIFEAAAFGRVERLREPLAADPGSASSFSDDGFTPLHLAVFAEEAESARVLIDHGADVDECSRGAIAQVSPLGTAAFVHSLDIARLLLDAGADVNGRAAGGFTALHSAASNGDLALVRELLGRGADPALETADGKTAADLAADESVKALLNRDGG